MKSVELCGYLTKKGGKRKNWKKRYFKLVEGKLFYYNNTKTTNSPLGFIELSKVTKIDIFEIQGISSLFFKKQNFDATKKKEKEDREYFFELVTPERTFELKTNDPKLRQYWIEGLTNLVHVPTNQIQSRVC